jgi:hypothetical protein
MEHIPWTPVAAYPVLENSCARLRARRLALDLVVPVIFTFLKALPAGNHHQILGLSFCTAIAFTRRARAAAASPNTSRGDCVNPIDEAQAEKGMNGERKP